MTIARIVKTRGVRGEVAAVLLTDFPARFDQISGVRILCGGIGHTKELEWHWFHQGRVILKFTGLNRPHEVEHFVGGEVQVPEEERVSPPEDTYFHSDLVGCTVRQDGQTLGTVADIFETGGAGANLVVDTPAGHEIMVPLARRFVLSVDVAAQAIDVQLPPGLLEVGSPSKRRKAESAKRKPDED